MTGVGTYLPVDVALQETAVEHRALVRRTHRFHNRDHIAAVAGAHGEGNRSPRAELRVYID